MEIEVFCVFKKTIRKKYFLIEIYFGGKRNFTKWCRHTQRETEKEPLERYREKFSVVDLFQVVGLRVIGQFLLLFCLSVILYVLLHSFVALHFSLTQRGMEKMS